MSWYKNYINNMAQNNKDYYEELAQEWINDYFDDTTLVKTIKEEKYPFNEEYVEYETHIDSVAEITTNVDKIIGDFISVIFKDCSHTNYRGQKYIVDNETYLCYDKINDLSKVAKSNLIRCNNEISWLDENNNILNEKVFVGYQLSSTNDIVTKKAIVSNRRRIVYMQYNDRTKDITINQRFMFQHNQCFRVEEIDNYNRESNTDNDVTMIKMFLVYSPLTSSDNKELNICDYYTNDYTIEINQDNIVQTKGFIGSLGYVVKNKNKVIDNMLVKWSTSNDNVVTIDDNGNYKIVGNIGDECVIDCCLLDNENISDKINIRVVDDYLPERVIKISPSDTIELPRLDSVEIKCGIYIEGSRQSGDITYTTNYSDEKYYNIKPTLEGYEVTNIMTNPNPLIITFKADNCEDVSVTINLDGFI